jgi:hypothetical protein
MSKISSKQWEDYQDRLADLQILAIAAPSGDAILSKCLEIADLLIRKNISYGNSALEPIRIFSKSDNKEQIFVRIDDKLNRLKNNQSFDGDQDNNDLIGYLVLLEILLDKERNNGV